MSIVVDLSAIRSNLAIARRLSGGGKQFATIKADAYGHGAVATAHALSAPDSLHQYSVPNAASTEPDDAFADGFAVVTVSEAIELRLSGIEKPILVLQGPQSPDACDLLVRHDLWPVIHDLHQHAWYSMHKHRQRLNAWLKVDTGMGRLGVQSADATMMLAADDGINWQGVLTHFACADEVDNPFTLQQINTFNSVEIKPSLQRSMANSSAVLAWPKATSDWARPGIMLYGCNPLDRALPDEIKLRSAMCVTAPLISVKRLRAGSGVGYAQSWHCPEDMPIGYVAIGYRDGLPRVLDDTASVWLDGTSCPIVGRVSMDSIAIDLRSAPQAIPGNRVEVWGPNAPIDQLAVAAGTINYELLTSIRGRREYITQG